MEIQSGTHTILEQGFCIREKLGNPESRFIKIGKKVKVKSIVLNFVK